MAIQVTKSFLPDKELYKQYIDEIWERGWLTNNGPLVKKLENELQSYLGVKNLLFVGNGTIAIQIAIKALELKGEIITTPFSYCATTTSILWENCTPVFVDVEEQTYNINSDLIESSITENTCAILATHVYGNPCEVEKIEEIAKRHNLKVIYDAAHAFGAIYKGQSVLSFGDVSTCSFHATKVFHSVEGGCIICKDDELYDKMYKYRSFGHINDDYYTVGINGKNSEFHAAMGLCNLPRVEEIIASRKASCETYDNLLDWSKLTKPTSLEIDFQYNYAYYPVIMPSEEALLKVKEELAKVEIFPRRYFYPSLNQLPYITNYSPCPVSESASQRALSLPLFFDMDLVLIQQIAEIMNSNI
ncbi:MAG: DegT/DnrJ/EryC1/StrS family aminotransferase [Spirosomataceae bacterium]